MMPTNSNE
uniref:Uncharacterized protein n=1 Tax=Anguilla anguilla TaxID=7936 RepID=A0A0E9T8D6_ANGAN